MLAGGDQRDLPRLEDGGDPHRDRFPRHVVLAEEVRRCILPGHRVERHQAGPLVGRRAWLVEADVPALPDPEHLEVDPAGLGDGPLVREAVLGECLARHAAVGDMDLLGPDVDVREQVLPHVAPVAVGAVRRHRVVLVEVEGHHAREIHLARLVAADQLPVDAERRAPRREAEHATSFGGRFPGDDLHDAVGQAQREVVVIRDHDGADVLAIPPAFDGTSRGAPNARCGGGFRGRHVAFLSSATNVHSRNNKPA